MQVRIMLMYFYMGYTVTYIVGDLNMIGKCFLRHDVVIDLPFSSRQYLLQRLRGTVSLPAAS